MRVTLNFYESSRGNGAISDIGGKFVIPSNTYPAPGQAWVCDLVDEGRYYRAWLIERAPFVPDPDQERRRRVRAERHRWLTCKIPRVLGALGPPLSLAPPEGKILFTATWDLPGFPGEQVTREVNPLDLPWERIEWVEPYAVQPSGCLGSYVLAVVRGQALYLPFRRRHAQRWPEVAAACKRAVRKRG